MANNGEIDIDHLRSWIGRSETDSDSVTPRLVHAFNATVLDSDAQSSMGDIVPLGLHWCLAPRIVPMGQLGQDGHPARGGFLPPVPLPRRMWAGGRLRFQDDLTVGDTVTRVSTISDVKVKTGRTGVLCFVVVDHVYSTERGDAIIEEQDIVYKAGSVGPAPAAGARKMEAPPESGEFHQLVEPTTPLLFRYSALTFNSHRIHYDRPYAMDVEHYGGIVVHGPLQATLLLAMASTMRSDKRCSEFSFRGMVPLLDTQSIAINGDWIEQDKARLWTGMSKSAPNFEAWAVW